MPPDTPAAADPTLTIPCVFCGAWNRVDAGRVLDRPKCGECAKPMLLDRPLPLTDDTFARVIAEAGIPVVVDFYADWCGPCKVMAPQYGAAASKLPQVRFAKLDIDRAPLASARHQIRSVPTLALFRGGTELARASGAMSAEKLLAWLRSKL